VAAPLSWGTQRTFDIIVDQDAEVNASASLPQQRTLIVSDKSGGAR